jgi:hypothetical protein
VNESTGRSLQLRNRWIDWAPIGLSAAAFAVVLAHLAIAGVATEGDEGWAAHLWQLVMLANGALVLWGALHRRKTTGSARTTLIAVQLLCMAIAATPVVMFRL